METKDIKRKKETFTSSKPIALKDPKNSLASLASGRITKGAFGQALEEFVRIHNVLATTVNKVTRSSDFMKIARAIDSKYVSVVASKKHNPTYDDQYRIAGGDKGMPKSYIGKPELKITGADGAHFLPSNAPDNRVGVDSICIQHNSGFQFIQELVHECCHLYNYAYSLAPTPKNLVASVRADIQEEIKVRKREKKILKEINKSLKTKLNFDLESSIVPAIVARDFSPGLGLTYLENSYFSYKLRQFHQEEGLSVDKARRIREFVTENNKVPYQSKRNPKTGLKVKSNYGQAWYNLLKAKKSWALFRKSSKKNSASAREAKIQQHAKLYFTGLRYAKMP